MMNSNPQILVALNDKDLLLICVPVNLGFVGGRGGSWSILSSLREDKLRKVPPSRMLRLPGPGKEKQRTLQKLLKYSIRKEHIIFHSCFLSRNKSYGHAQLQDDGDVQASPIIGSGQEPDHGEEEHLPQ